MCQGPEVSKLFSLTVVFLLFVFSVNARPQTTISGGRGMFRVQSARTVQSGSILVNTYFLAFFNNDKLNGYGNNHTLSIALTYGLKDNLEIIGRAVPYQDDQVRDWGPPGETTLGLKWCTLVGGKYVRTGLLSFFRLPTAKSHNVPYEAYSSGKVAMGISGLITFYLPSDLPLQF